MSEKHICEGHEDTDVPIIKNYKDEWIFDSDPDHDMEFYISFCPYCGRKLE